MLRKYHSSLPFIEHEGQAEFVSAIGASKAKFVQGTYMWADCMSWTSH